MVLPAFHLDQHHTEGFREPDIILWARAYAANPTASTPLLSALAQARGIELSELVQRVIAKADILAMASGSIIGQRQALEDRLDTCTTVEDVQAIIVNIVMPA